VSPVGRRVFIVSASMGAGHDGAARELARRVVAAGDEARVVDFLDAGPLGTGHLMRLGYELQLKLAPWLYEATYRLWYLLPFLIRPFVSFFTVLTGHRLMRWIREWQPDVIVSTYPLSSLVLAREREKGKLERPLATFITDFAVHPLWVHPEVDLHLCVHPISARHAAERSGRPAVAPGPLVPERFHRLPDRAANRRSLGADDDDRLVLVVSGSWGVGAIESTFDAIAESGRYTPVAVCGNNVKLRRRLQAKGRGIVLGWTDDMPGLMAGADALVQNAGGLTCMEAFAAGLPVVSYRPIAGHGRDNARYMEDAGVAALAHHADELVPVLDRVTGLAGRGMARAGQALFAGDGVDDVLELAGAPAPVPAPVAAARRRGSARRRVAAAAASVAAAYATMTVGISTAAAHGLGVAHARHNSGAVYLGVRLGPEALADPDLPAVLARSHVSAIVDGSTAARSPETIQRLRAAGVDVANGGWGRRDNVRWSRAQADVVRSGRSIHAACGHRPREFVPGRRVDGFDLASARLAHERVVLVNRIVPAGAATPSVHAGKVYVVDGRHDDSSTIERTLTELESSVESGHLAVAPLTELT